MRRLVLLILVCLLSMSAVRVQGKEAEPSHGKTAGDGYKHLKFTGKPDDQGLIWNLQEPLRNGDYWAVSVLNTSGKTVSKLCTKIEYHVDGAWYVVGLFTWKHYLTPYRINQNEFAIATGDVLSPSESDWDDVRLTACDDDEQPTDQAIDLRIGDLVFADGNLSGTVLNRNAHSVKDILVYYRCVDADGVIYKSEFFGLDIRKLDPDQSEPFEHGHIECKDAADVIANALADTRN